ncbi:unnamed protein product [Linum trigynum]|uniref:Uncharacterized protein n=1 Tax=Linum trigynum TaxID=586398 RepID=A0AAV2F825_9ROSI
MPTLSAPLRDAAFPHPQSSMTNIYSLSHLRCCLPITVVLSPSRFQIRRCRWESILPTRRQRLALHLYSGSGAAAETRWCPLSFIFNLGHRISRSAPLSLPLDSRSASKVGQHRNTNSICMANPCLISSQSHR